MQIERLIKSKFGDWYTYSESGGYKVVCNKCGTKSMFVNDIKEVFYCFSCNNKGHLSQLFPEFKSNNGVTKTKPTKIKLERKKVEGLDVLPVGARPINFEYEWEEGWKYLLSRGVNPEYVEFYTVDKVYAIFPVYENGNIVFWQSRAIYNILKEKTRNPVKYNFGGKEEFLYNYDSLNEGGLAILVEGLFDSIHTDAMCTFGHTFSDIQMDKIMKKKPSMVLFAYDSEVYKKTINRIKELRKNYSYKAIFCLKLGDTSDERDPADMGCNEFYRRVLDFVKINKQFIIMSGADYTAVLNDINNKLIKSTKITVIT